MFFWFIFFSSFILQCLFDEESCFFVLSSMSLMESFQSHDLCNRSEGLAWFDFCFFKSIFNMFVVIVFLAFLFIKSSQFHVLDHVFDLLTRVGSQCRSRLFFFYKFFKFIFLHWLVINLLIESGFRVS